MMSLRATLGLALGLMMAGCASTPTAEVTRFHLGGPIPSDSIKVVDSHEPTPDAMLSLEFRSHAAIVAQELATVGFRPQNEGPTAYIAILNVQQTTRAGMPQPAPFSIGIGGGSFSGNTAISGGVSVPVGQTRGNDIRVNMVSLRIRRQSDKTAVWEGRAIQEIPANQQGASLSAAVPALSRALLSNFPGESGVVVTVPLR
jgi:hypothetical protein